MMIFARNLHKGQQASCCLGSSGFGNGKTIVTVFVVLMPFQIEASIEYFFLIFQIMKEIKIKFEKKNLKNKGNKFSCIGKFRKQNKEKK